MVVLSTREEQALNETASKLGINPKTLFNLINFESGWNPKIKNPLSSARGLIQFMDATAREMGYSGGSSELIQKHPTRESQLRTPVYNYLKRWKPFPTQQSIYMAVFYPKYRYVPPSTEFPDSVKKVNPNIVTVQDYVNKVNRKAGNYAVKGGIGLGTIAILTLAYIYRKKWLKYLK